jgi:hypothetical protein
MEGYAHQNSPVIVDQNEDDFVILRNVVKDARELYGLPKEAVQPVEREPRRDASSDHDSEGDSEEHGHSESDSSDDEDDGPSIRSAGVQTQQPPEYASIGVQTGSEAARVEVDYQAFAQADPPALPGQGHPAVTEPPALDPYHSDIGHAHLSSFPGISVPSSLATKDVFTEGPSRGLTPVNDVVMAVQS